MVTIEIDYEGQLRCGASHQQSGTELKTDAPVDNHGRGESFSPTDLIATALGSCMATIMGIFAEKKGIGLEGMKMVVKKEMSADLPRRISVLHVEIVVPVKEDHPEKEGLIAAAEGCPVNHSIHPDIEVRTEWKWVG